jgi:hypothetical protein
MNLWVTVYCRNACGVSFVSRLLALHLASLPILIDLLLVLAYNQSATICIKGNCNHLIYCASCTSARRIIHRHKDSTYVVKLQRKVSLPVARVQCAKCRKSKSSQPGFFFGVTIVEYLSSSGLHSLVSLKLTSALPRLVQTQFHRYFLRPLQILCHLLDLHRRRFQGCFF